VVQERRRLPNSPFLADPLPVKGSDVPAMAGIACTTLAHITEK
jgi:hypothetical protein